MRHLLTRRLAQIAGVLLSLTIFVIALVTLRDILAEVSPQDVIQAFRATPKTAILGGLGFVALSYLAMTGYDAIAIAHLKKRIPYRRTSLASFTSYAVANNLGFPILTGGSVRYRLYSLEGLSAIDIAVLTAIITLTYTLGIFTALGATLIISPTTAAAIDRLPPAFNVALGIALLAGIASYVIWVSRRRRRISYKGFRIRLPGPRLTLAQIAISVSELILAAAALYVLLPADVDLPFSTVAVAFIAAIGLGVLSHAPGGIGVFEAVMLVALPQIPPDKLLASLLMFRCVYYLVPLSLAALLLAYHEASHPLGIGRRLGDEATRSGSDLAPQIIGVMIVTVGMILVLSGAAPAIASRMTALSSVVPLALIEIAHVATGLIGLTLIILARGVFRRQAQSFRLARVLLFIALPVALMRGLDIEEAGIVLFTLLVLQSSRRAFYRPGPALGVPFTAPWIALISGGIGLFVLVGLFVYQSVEAGLGSWFTFDIFGHYERFLRLGLILVVVGAGFQLFLLARRTPLRNYKTGTPPVVWRMLETQPTETSHLAITGDKMFLTSKTGNGAIAYDVSRRTYVAAGGPIGDTAERLDLLWALRDRAEAHGARAAVFDIGPDMAQTCRDAGMVLAEIGEAAIVEIGDPDDTAETPERLAHKRSLRRAERFGVKTGFVPAPQIHRLMPDMRLIADQAAHGAPRGFAVARFSEDYAAALDHVVAHIGDRLIGFAALSGLRSDDAFLAGVFRAPEADTAIVSALLSKAIAEAGRAGCKTLDLGLTPLDALDKNALWPLWEQIGSKLFPLGTHADNFPETRALVAGLATRWEPRSLASYEGMAIPDALFDTAALTLGKAHLGQHSRRGFKLPRLGRLKPTRD